MSKASAPGKVHLIGEHAVVYGKPAIIAAIGKRCYVDAEKNAKIIVKSKDLAAFELSADELKENNERINELWQKCFQKNDFSELFAFEKNPEGHIKAILGKIQEMLRVDGFSLHNHTEIPVGSGLGSSAAFAVASVRAISEIYGKKLSNEEINNIAFECEKLMHGIPSGGDNSACCFGGLVWFKKGEAVKPLKDEIPYRLENFVLVYTKKPEKTTGELVQQVRNLEEGYRNPRVEAIGEMAEEMLDVLKSKDFTRMKEIINLTQKNLTELGVSCREIDKIAEKVCSIGGAAKLCGAGGGGTMLCWHEDKGKLIETIKKLGYEPWEADLAVDGVRIE